MREIERGRLWQVRSPGFTLPVRVGQDSPARSRGRYAAGTSVDWWCGYRLDWLWLDLTRAPSLPTTYVFSVLLKVISGTALPLQAQKKMRDPMVSFPLKTRTEGCDPKGHSKPKRSPPSHLLREPSHCKKRKKRSVGQGFRHRRYPTGSSWRFCEEPNPSDSVVDLGSCARFPGGED